MDDEVMPRFRQAAREAWSGITSAAMEQGYPALCHACSHSNDGNGLPAACEV
jgi:hypothetical protein